MKNWLRRLVTLLVLTVTTTFSSVQAHDQEGGNGLSQSLMTEGDEDSSPSWLNSAVASGIALAAVCLASYLGRHCDYLCPSNYFTLIKPRHWKLPHEKYLEEQLANESPNEAAVCLPAFDLEEEE